MTALTLNTFHWCTFLRTVILLRHIINFEYITLVYSPPLCDLYYLTPLTRNTLHLCTALLCVILLHHSTNNEYITFVYSPPLCDLLSSHH
jgi:hypothetical protein